MNKLTKLVIAIRAMAPEKVILPKVFNPRDLTALAVQHFTGQNYNTPELILSTEVYNYVSSDAFVNFHTYKTVASPLAEGVDAIVMGFVVRHSKAIPQGEAYMIAPDEHGQPIKAIHLVP